MDDQKFQRDLTSFSQEQDFLKHLTTLSTGSILLMVTFLEKLFARPVWKTLIWVSMISFVLSIIGCVFIHMISVIEMQYDEKERSKNIFWPIFLLFVAFGGFLTGIISLTVFALKNFYVG